MHVGTFEDELETLHVIARSACDEAIHLSACCAMDCVAALALTRRVPCHTGSAIEYFTWLSAKLDSIEAMPSRRVSLFFRNAS